VRERKCDLLLVSKVSERLEQALVKIALEPQCEARFEPNSYGFRPGRSAHDAIEAIFLSIKQKPILRSGQREEAEF